MYEAARWNEDTRYFSPMATINGSSLYIDDIVRLKFTAGGWDTTTLGKIEKFFKKVRGVV